MGDMVEMANRLAADIKRPIELIHMPVPRDRADDGYFAPLKRLQLKPETELMPRPGALHRRRRRHARRAGRRRAPCRGVFDRHRMRLRPARPQDHPGIAADSRGNRRLTLARRAPIFHNPGTSDSFKAFATMAVPAMAFDDNERFFLGVARSATGRAWRDRLDARGAARALAIAQRAGVPELLARVLAGRGVEADEAQAYLDPTIRHLMPDPHTLTDMEAAAERLARRDRARRARRHFRRLRRRRRDRRGLAVPLSAAMRPRSDRAYPRPHLRRLRPERRGHPRLCREGRDAAGHRRLRHHQHRGADGGEEARARHRGDRPSSGRRGAAAGGRGGQPQPRRRSLAARPSRRRRARLPHVGGAEPRPCARAISGTMRGRSPICSRRCIWSRSARSPTWCRSRA